MAATLKIALIGYGHMGKLIASHWVDTAYEVIVFRNHPKENGVFKEVAYEDRMNYKDYDFDIVIFAIAPSQAKIYMKDYTCLLHSNSVLVSIMAGIQTSYFQNIFGSKLAIIRIMPNTPIALKLGILDIFTSQCVSDDQKRIVYDAFKPLGMIVAMDQEDQMDRFAALTASGPAYVYYFLEILEDMMQKASIPHARDTVLRLVKGSVEMATQNSASFLSLRKQVATKGGMTEAALHSLLLSDVKEQFEKAVNQAVKRSQEMS